MYSASRAHVKKVLALVMAFAMAFTMMASAAFTDQADITCTEAVEMLSALGVINGYEDGSFKPNGTVTRAEMAAMIYIIRNGGNKDASSFAGSKTTFTDVPADAWYAGYVKYCQSVGIISGRSASIFDPNATVTGVEAALMCLRTMGFSAEKSDIGGSTWSITTIGLASENGILDDVTTAMDAACPRQYAAQMLYNMLDADVVKWSNDKEDYENETETVTYSDLAPTYEKDQDGNPVESGWNTVTFTETQNIDVAKKYMGLSKPEGILTSVTKEENKDTYKVTVGATTYTKVAENYIDLLGQDVKVLIKDGKADKVYGVYATDKNKVVTALVDNIDDLDDGNNKFKIDGTEYKTTVDNAENLPVYSTKDMDYYATLGAMEGYCTVTLIDSNDDDKLDRAIYTPIAVAQIDYLTSTKMNLEFLGGTGAGWTAVFDLEDDDVTLYDGAEEDDYVVVVADDYTVDGYTVVAKADVVSGEVTATKGNVSDVKVDGTWYKVVDDVDGDAIKLNDSYDFAVANGFVFKAEKTKGNISASNILYVEKAGALNSGISDGVEAKVYFADGTSKTVIVTEYDDGTNEYDVVSGKPGTDEIAATEVAGKIAKNIFTYSEKDGEYSLEVIDADNKGSYDNYISETKTIIDEKTSAGVRFADDAVIFVNDDDGVKVITGKTVTGWKAITAESVKGLADKSNGTKYIAIGAIDLGNLTAKTDAAVYGFITSDISNSKEDGTNYLNFTMWNGKEPVDVKVEDKVSIAKYDFVSFDWADEEAKEADTNDFIVKDHTDAVAITAFVDGDSITFSDGVSQDFADDYFVIGVDTKKGEGSTASLKTAKDDPNSEKDENGDYTKQYANAIYFSVKDGSDNVIECVFVDVNGAIYTDKNGSAISVDK